MKAPDIVESWLWRPADEIIERLLARSSRTLGLPAAAPLAERARDRYYTMARRFHVKRLMRGRL